MKLLAIETSGKTLSLALADSGTIIAEVFYQAGHTHSERLLPELEKMLSVAGWKLREIEKIAVGVGPGSFTGIRIGLVCARALAQELNIPLVGLDTLAIIEAGMPACGRTVVPCIDAMRNEVYVRGKKGIEIVAAESFFKALAKKKSKVIVAGNAVIAFEPLLKKNKLSYAPSAFAHPRAAILAQCAEPLKGAHYEKVLPVYVRKSWAEESRGKHKE